MNWQPIETAPRDGTKVLGFGDIAAEGWSGKPGEVPDDIQVRSYAAVCWTENSDFPGYNWKVDIDAYFGAWMNPTHWKPLEPPGEDN